MTYTLKQNEGTYIELAMGKDIHLSTGCMGSSSLGKEVFQAQDPFLYGQVGVKRLNDDTACPNCFVLGRGLEGRRKVYYEEKPGLENVSEHHRQMKKVQRPAALNSEGSQSL